MTLPGEIPSEHPTADGKRRSSRRRSASVDVSATRKAGLVMAVVLVLSVGCGDAVEAPAAILSQDSTSPSTAPTQGERKAPGTEPGSELEILGAWEPPELAVLQEVVAPFEERTGHQVRFTITRDLREALEQGLAAGDPPDIAGLPGPGYLAELARAGHLVDLGTVLDPGAYKRETAPAFVHLGTVDGQLVGAFLKGTVKGLLWYDPSVYRQGPFATWARLQHAAMTSIEDVPPWCIGLASDEASGWPGTDWIEDFLLRQSGPQAYDEWVAGRLRWTSPEVRWAFQSYGTVVGELDVAGGIEGALETHFSEAGDGLFTDPPGCLFAHQGTFMATFLDEAVVEHGGSYRVMPFPDIDPRFRGALIGAGDLIALLRDSEGGRELIAYLLSSEAQEILVSHGGALSGNVTLREYPDAILREQAAMLADAQIFRFDASDSMPEEMSRAFWRAVLDFTADQSALDAILAELDAVQAEAYGQG